MMKKKFLLFLILLLLAKVVVSQSISNLQVRSGEPYEVVEFGLSEGNLLYIDRGYTLVSVPVPLRGFDYVRSACDDKFDTGENFLVFDIAQNSKIYIAQDARITEKPSWLDSFDDTGYNIELDDFSSTNVVLNVFERVFPSGTVSLGGNGGISNSVMYLLAVEELSCMDFDLDCNKIIEPSEIFSFINLWKRGDVLFLDLIDSLKVWKVGYYCFDGETDNCDTGLNGICKDGFKTCHNGVWGNCIGLESSEEEVCDGLDNDCDGSVDNGCVASEISFSLHPNQPLSDEYRGALTVADVDSDNQMEFIVMTKENQWDEGTAGLGVYEIDGSILWYNHDIDIYNNGNAENHGLPGWQGPGYSKGDVDGDGQTEIVYIKEDLKTLVILNGLTGAQEKTIDLDPGGNEPGFGLCQIVNLRGEGDKDIICQGWDIGNFDIIASFNLDTGQRLWRRTDYIGVKHGGFRAADIDDDGLDEVAGAVIIDHDGTRMNSWNYPVGMDYDSKHFDSIFIYDVRPDLPGLEIILLEELWSPSDDHTSVVNPSRVIWRRDFNLLEPQNSAVGDFDTSRAGLEIWCRSRFDSDQRPWVYDAQGNVIANWVMNDKKPAGWTEKGIENINSIDWDGSDRQYIAAKERHEDGDIAIINAMTGDFIKTWSNKASRIYVADVLGDYREEIVVLNSEENKVYVYSNGAVNTNNKNSYWSFNYYKRQKDNFNYYSP